jgi:hypothetical protein
VQLSGNLCARGGTNDNKMTWALYGCLKELVQFGYNRHKNYLVGTIGTTIYQGYSVALLNTVGDI